jgi:hypothetical protein
MLTRYSNVELANFAEREVHMRRRVYRRLVARFQPIPDLHRRASSGNDIEGAKRAAAEAGNHIRAALVA